MQTPFIDEQSIVRKSDFVCEIKEHYARFLLGAVISTLSKVDFIDAEPLTAWPWVRDPVVFLQRKKLILHSSSDHTVGNKAGSIVKTIKTYYPEAEVRVLSNCIEGGNILTVNEGKVLLHGNDPGGHYEETESGRSGTAELQKILKEKEITVMGLDLNQKKYKGSSSVYYHLDTFLHTLPDGRVLLLSKDILNENSYRRLKDTLGDRLVDLKINCDSFFGPDLNILSYFSSDGQIKVITDNNHQSVIDRLDQLDGVQCIGLHQLNPDSYNYNSQLAEQVSEFLSEKGFLNVDPETLLERIPEKATYRQRTKNGKFYETEIDCGQRLINACSTTTNEYLVKPYKAFSDGYSGSVHCLTLDFPFKN